MTALSDPWLNWALFFAVLFVVGVLMAAAGHRSRRPVPPPRGPLSHVRVLHQDREVE